MGRLNCSPFYLETESEESRLAIAERDREIYAESLRESNARYLDKVRELSIVRQVSHLLRYATDSSDVCTGVVDVLVQETEAENVSIFILNDTEKELQLLCARGKEDEEAKFFPTPWREIPVQDSAAGWVVRNAKPLRLESTRNTPPFTDLPGCRVHVGSLLAVPLVACKKAIGVLHLSHPQEDVFTYDDLCTASIVADQLAAAMWGARIRDQADIPSLVLHERIALQERLLEEQDCQLSRTEEKLSHNENLAEIGKMIAGVAHELNNCLAPILIYSEMLIDSQMEDPDSYRLDVIHESAKKARGIVQSLLDFSRPINLERTATSINDVIMASVRAAEPYLKDTNIKVELNLDPGITPVEIDPEKMGQVVTNLILNAIHAMEESGGQLSLESHKTESEVQFQVKDTGHGISPGNEEKIFEPFFSTKKNGKGTGLGLSASSSIVRVHGGSISVDTQVGVGTAFTVEIPVDAPLADRMNRRTIRRMPLAVTTRGSVLVVDDDDKCLNAICDILERFHDVTTAHGTQEAVELLESSSFDALLVDYRLPQDNGDAIYRWVQQKKPDLTSRFILMTGETSGNGSNEFLKKAPIPILIKPFSAESLIDAINHLLIDEERNPSATGSPGQPREGGPETISPGQ